KAAARKRVLTKATTDTRARGPTSGTAATVKGRRRGGSRAASRAGSAVEATGITGRSVVATARPRRPGGGAESSAKRRAAGVVPAGTAVAAPEQASAPRRGAPA